MRVGNVLLCALLLLLCGRWAVAATVRVDNRGVHGRAWQDIDKALDGDDELLCWAATAANILYWGGWEAYYGNTAQQIFDTYKHHWVNKGGWTDLAWRWWIDDVVLGSSLVDVPGGGNHWPQYAFDDFYHRGWGRSGAMDAIADFINAGYGTALVILNPWNQYHVMSVWAYEYDDVTGDYIAVYVTNSDDDFDGLMRAPVSQDAAGDWHLGGWFLNDTMIEVKGLEKNPTPVVPEPGTLLLVLAGVLALLARAGRRSRAA